LIIKICGITTVEDAVMVANAGADWVGLNFWPDSPRFVSEERARAITAALPSAIRAVGVFVDADQQEMDRIARDCGLHMLQLHGNERPETVTALETPAFKAIRVGTQNDVENASRYVSGGDDLFLVDARHPTLPGGTGIQVATELARALQPLGRMLLAGGLTPDNVHERVREVRPAGVDTASGVESTPGRKDAVLVRRFVQEARSAEAAEKAAF
jgi:phosphoribosylanthranilate isomerase